MSPSEPLDFSGDWSLVRVPWVASVEPEPVEQESVQLASESYRSLIDRVNHLGHILDDLGEYRWRYPRTDTRYKAAQIQMVQCLGWRILWDMILLAPEAETELRAAIGFLMEGSLDSARDSLREIQLGIYYSEVQQEGLTEVVVVLWVLGMIERFLKPAEMMNLDDTPGDPSFVGRVPSMEDLQRLVEGVAFMMEEIETLEQITDNDLLSAGEHGRYLAGLYCTRWSLRFGRLAEWWAGHRK